MVNVAMNLLTTKKKIALTGYPLQVQLDISNKACMLLRVSPVFQHQITDSRLCTPAEQHQGGCCYWWQSAFQRCLMTRMRMTNDLADDNLRADPAGVLCDGPVDSAAHLRGRTLIRAELHEAY